MNSNRQRAKTLFYINSCSCRNDPHPTYQTRVPEPEDNKYRYFLDLRGRTTCEDARFPQSNYPRRSPWDPNQANVSLEALDSKTFISSETEKTESNNPLIPYLREPILTVYLFFWNRRQACLFNAPSSPHATNYVL